MNPAIPAARNSAATISVAPCTAMVFVWSYLTRGDAAYTLVQVALNDLIMLFAFAPIVVFLLGLLAVHLVLNRPRMVDTLIDTESEMRKVSWPSRREVKSATIVVVVVTVVLGLSLYGFDWALRRIFHLIFH